MKRIPGIRRLLRLPTGEGRVARDVNEEIEFHLEERTRTLVARGMDPDAARAEAEREFGDLREARAELERIGHRRARQTRRADWRSDLAHDVRYAGRTLLRSPGFTLVAVLTLALGVGATTAIYSLVDGVLLRPLGVAEPERLVVIREWRVESDRPPRAIPGTVSPANFFDWQEQAQSFESMSYFTQWPMNLTGVGEPREAQVQVVSANFFSTLGVQPMLGRAFRPEEDDVESGAGPAIRKVAVLSHGLWTDRYGGDPGIVGRTIQVNDDPVEVVGVMGPDFRMLGHKPDLWMPLALPVGDRTNTGRFLTAVARLKPGVTHEQGAAELKGIATALEEAYPEFNARMGTWMVPFREEVVGEVRPALLVLLGAVGMLLLIACTNVANLLLGRASTRSREIAVRLSLGATRERLIRQLLTESLLLSLIGGVLGVAAAALGTGALLRSLPASVQLPRLDAVAMDGRILAFAVAVTVLTAVVFGLAPALAASRSDLQGSLRAASRGSTSGRSPMRLRKGLVVAEVGLALMLLVGAGLLLRSFQKLQAVDIGLRPENTLTFRLVLGAQAYGTASAVLGFTDRLVPELEALPGVQAVGTIWYPPLSEEKSRTTAFRADRLRPSVGEEKGADIRVVGGDYFAAQGIRLLRGRVLDERDHAEAEPTVVINEALAAEQFPGEDPVGKRLIFNWGDNMEAEIVGVVEDVHGANLTEEPATAFYRPLSQHPSGRLNVMMRTTGDPLALAGAVQGVVRDLDPNLPVSDMRTMESAVANATARSRLSGYLLGGFAALALLLAAVGLYGVISYGVTQRRGEIGVRVALGAHSGDIVRLIVKQGLALTGVGLVLGLLGALALTRLLRSLLFGITAVDPATYVGVATLLAVAALLATYVPASRAARLDPTSTLRTE